jgi:hypothetical protein
MVLCCCPALSGTGQLTPSLLMYGKVGEKGLVYIMCRDHSRDQP